MSFDITAAEVAAVSGPRPPRDGTKLDAGVIDGVPYEIRRTVNVPSMPSPSANADAQESLNGSTAKARSDALLVVLFRTADRAWTFKANVYSPLQEERVRALLVAEGMRLCQASAVTEGPPHDTVVPIDTYKAIREGSSATEVMTVLGRPQGSQPRPPDGLALWYLVNDGSSRYRHARLDFNRAQRLEGCTLDPTP